MAITTRVGLACKGTVSEDGETIYFTDETGNYNSASNPLGYGLPGGITSASVTSFTITHYYNSLGVTVSFNFTAASNVITAATMTDVTGTSYNILSSLSSTTFPFVTANKFNLRNDNFGGDDSYPTFADGLMTITYNIVGVFDTTSYSYTTSKQVYRDNDLCCCTAALAITADPNCGCSDSVIQTVNRIKFWHYSALAAINTNSTTDSLNYFTKAQELCDAGDCGC